MFYTGDQCRRILTSLGKPHVQGDRQLRTAVRAAIGLAAI